MRGSDYARRSRAVPTSRFFWSCGTSATSTSSPNSRPTWWTPRARRRPCPRFRSMWRTPRASASAMWIADGNSRHPLMLHTSVSGSIDRNLYALLEQQAIRMQKGQKASYPFWLAPTQIRLIPVKEQHTEHCQELAQKLQGRVDIDDRSETLSKRIRAAEKEWVPWIIAVGDKEAESEELPVRVRGEGRPRSLSPGRGERALLAQEMAGKAFRPINLPRLLSMRPLFRG